ncbi:hypothetical protein ACIBG7_06040 [Nonomuraea sp. NPDC050328]|uniref:hypothetical protein n=1 Tax=Nonomuraea sp. NPDC050328 TaxID=3364361 RepID=UPI003796BE77
MDRLERTGAALAAGLVLSVLMTGCRPGCEAAANADIRDLKEIVSGLLPEAVAVTLEEGNDCDSGSGGFISFTASVRMDSEQIFQKFLVKGWSRIDEPHDEQCVICVDGLDGVSTDWEGEVVYLMASKRDDSTMDILAAFQ